MNVFWRCWNLAGEAARCGIALLYGSRQERWIALNRGLYLGITGWVCDERRGLELRELLPLSRADRLLLETDAPYLLPRDMQPKPPST